MLSRPFCVWKYRVRLPHSRSSLLCRLSWREEKSPPIPNVHLCDTVRSLSARDDKSSSVRFSYPQPWLHTPLSVSEVALYPESFRAWPLRESFRAIGRQKG